MIKRVVAVDLGATSGRVMAARVDVAGGTDGSPVLDLVEVHRFANGGVRAPDGSLRWDIRRIHAEMLEGIRLAAAAGTTPDVAHDVPAALRGWLKAPLVLVGADLADDLARAAPSRREAVFVVLVGAVPDRAFQVALSLGAESVAELPRSEGWLVELLTDGVDTGPARGLTIGVIGGSGGSGATTFACALAQVAARAGPAVVLPPFQDLGEDDVRVGVAGVDRHDRGNRAGFRWLLCKEGTPGQAETPGQSRGPVTQCVASIQVLHGKCPK